MKARNGNRDHLLTSLAADDHPENRSILLSYLHDCCHCIYFALAPSFFPSEMVLNLPCEDALWQATSATEWMRVLQTPSPYGDMQARLTGASMPETLAAIAEPRQLDIIALTPFGHFVLVHSILRHLYTVCINSRLPKAIGRVDDEAIMEQEVFGLQFALHNWLMCWRHSPDMPKVDPSDEPPFLYHGKVSL